jgi:outer membrane protein OmpU
MKKLLLCTTALASLVASSAFAAQSGAFDGDNVVHGGNPSANLQITLGGSATFESGHINQDKTNKTNFAFSPNQSSNAFYTKSKLYVKAEGKGDNNVVYGAVIRVQTIANGSNGASDARNDRTHIYVDTDAGTIQLGSNSSASKLMQLNAGTIASATGGIDGDFSTFAVTNLSAYNGMGLTGVDNLYNNLDRQESSRKITYLSPRISGVQFGASYTPDQANNAAQNNLTQNNNYTVSSLNNTYLGNVVRLKNIWSLGLSYSNTFANDVSVAVSATTDMGRRNNSSFQLTQSQVDSINSVSGDAYTLDTFNSPTQRKNLKSYSVGTVVGYNGFSVAGSYTNDGKSLINKATPNGFKSSWWTAGVAYQTGPMSTSLTYLAGKKGFSTTNNNLKTKLVSLGVDYEVMPGMKPFAEVTQATYTPSNKNTATKAKATVFIFGTKVKF